MTSNMVVRFDPRKSLLELMEPLKDLNPGARRRRMKIIGEYLAELIDRHRGPFTIEYLENAIAGRQDIGEPLRRALMAEYLSRDGRCPIAGGFSPAEVKTRGNVETGALILASSRRCNYCNVAYVPKSGNQMYCSALCRNRHRSNGRE